MKSPFGDVGYFRGVALCALFGIALGGCDSGSDDYQIPASDLHKDSAAPTQPVDLGDLRATWVKTLDRATTSNARELQPTTVKVTGDDFHGDGFYPKELHDKTIQIMRKFGEMETTVTLFSAAHHVTGELLTIAENPAITADPIITVWMFSITGKYRKFQLLHEQNISRSYKLDQKIEIPAASYILEVDYYKFSSNATSGTARPIFGIKGFTFE